MDYPASQHVIRLSEQDIVQIVDDLQNNGVLRKYSHEGGEGASHVTAARIQLARALADGLVGVDSRGQSASLLNALSSFDVLRKDLRDANDVVCQQGYPVQSHVNEVSEKQAVDDFKAIENALREKIRSLVPSNEISALQMLLMRANPSASVSAAL